MWSSEINLIRKQIQELSQVDFNENQLFSDEKFVHAGPKLAGRTIQTVSSSEGQEDLDRAVKKIRKIIEKNPIIVTDANTLNDLLVLNSHLVASLNDFSNTQEDEELYMKIAKLSLLAIDLFLLHQPSTWRELGKILHDEEAKEWLGMAARQLVPYPITEEEYPSYFPLAPSPGVKSALFSLAEKGHYFITNEGKELFINYCIDANKFNKIKFEITSEGKLFYENSKGEIFLFNKLEELLFKLQEEDVIPRELNMHPLPSTSRIAAIEKIQAAFKGWKTRQKVIFPSQILPFLMNHLIDNSEAPKLARALCREINEMSLNPEKYRGKSVRFENVQKTYPFPLLSEGEKSKTELMPAHLNCWIEMPPDGKTIRVVIIPHQSFINKGTYKEAHRSQTFEIPLRIVQRKRETRYTPTVDFKLLEPTLVDDGLEIQKLILEKKPDLKIAPLLQKYLPSAGTEGQPPSRHQSWFNADFLQAIRSSIPLDLKGTERYSLNSIDKMEVILDIALSLKGMHGLGYVHSDVKAENILVKKITEGRAEGYLADFDIACQPGLQQATNYLYWDLCTCAGFVTPFTDIYGLALILGEAMLPGFKIDRNLQTLVNKKSETTKNLILAIKADLKNRYPEEFKALAINTTTASLDQIKRALFSLKTKNYGNKNLVRLEQELKVIETTLLLIDSVLRTNAELHSYLTDKERWNLLTSSGTSESERQKVMEEVKNKFPYFSMKTMVASLAEIRFLLEEIK